MLVVTSRGCLGVFATLVGCGEASVPSPLCSQDAGGSSLIVLETDQQRRLSAIARLERDGCLREVPDVALGSDPSLSVKQGRAFVNVRDEGVVLELDPKTLTLKRSFAAYTEGERQPNPQDLDVDDSGNIWITRYDMNSLARLSSRGQFLGVTNLAAAADADGRPEMGAITIVKGRAYVSMELLDRLHNYAPSGPGKIAVVDVASPDQIVTTLELPGRNPFGAFVLDPDDPGKRWVVLPGRFEQIEPDTGIAMLDLKSGVSELRVGESALGGSPIEVAIASASEAYATVAAPDVPANAMFLVRFNPSTGSVGQVLSDTRASDRPGFFYAGLALTKKAIVVGDRTPGKARLRWFDRQTGKETAAVPTRVAAPLSIANVAD